MMSPPTAIAALVAGELDFSSTTGAATSAIMRGLPLRRYFYVQAEPAHVLLAQPEIKSIQELNGKTIGVTALTDAVGMSTVHETIAARHAGLRVVAVSAITNYAEGMGEEAVSHEQTLRDGARAGRDLGPLITRFVAG